MRIALSLLALLYSGLLCALEVELPQAIPGEGESGFWGLQFENDILGSATDKYYTQGLELSYARKGDAPPWLMSLARRLPLYEQGDRHGVSYTLGQKIFTPADISVPTLQPNDRPYAGYLYSAFTYTNSVVLNPDLQHVNVFELNLGLVGPSSLGEEVQTLLHQLLGVPIAEGWDHQLNDELTLGVGYVHKWRMFEPSVAGTELEVSPHISMVLGNAYTYLAGGVMFRWGKGLRRDMGPPNIRPGFVGSTYFVPRVEPNWYLFLGHETRLVARDIFLDGNTFSDSHRVQRELVVGDIQLGFAYHINQLRIAISNVLRSKEFTLQDQYTQFGSVNLTYYY